MWSFVDHQKHNHNLFINVMILIRLKLLLFIYNKIFISHNFEKKTYVFMNRKEFFWAFVL